MGQEVMSAIRFFGPEVQSTPMAALLRQNIRILEQHPLCDPQHRPAIIISAFHPN